LDLNWRRSVRTQTERSTSAKNTAENIPLIRNNYKRVQNQPRWECR